MNELISKLENRVKELELENFELKQKGALSYHRQCT